MVFENATCFDAPANFSSLTWDDADMVLMVTAEFNDTVPYAAYAGPCRFDLGSFRPKAGLVNLNLAFILPKNFSLVDQMYNHMQQTTVEHEITHALGFLS